MRWAAVALGLLGCSAPQAPTEYAWAPVRPPPVPGTGLPTRGQPGPTEAPRANPQPQPRPERLLPPSREPGLWATREPGSDGPAQVHDIPDLPQVLAGVEPAVLARCARGVVADVERHRRRLAVTLSDRERRCAHAIVLIACLELEQDGRLEESSREWVLARFPLYRLAQYACAGGPDTSASRAVRDAVLRERAQ